MRLPFMLLVGGLMTALTGAPAPTELETALRDFRSEPPRGWTYLQTTTAEGKSTVERHDASKPEFDRWSLQQKDGRPPDADAVRHYAEARSRRSRGGTAPKLAEQLDTAAAELLAQDENHATYRCLLKAAEAGDRTAAYLRATLVLHRPTRTIESIELRNTAPFSPAIGVKIAELRTTLTYSLPAGDLPSLPLRVATTIRGTAFWFKSLDAEREIRFSDYTRTKLAAKP